MQASIEVSVEKVESAAANNDAKDDVECLSVLALKEKEFTGSLGIGFPKNTFLAVVEGMLGEAQSDINNDNIDACGELLNIVYASARVKINQAGFSFEPAIPSTVRGNNLSVAQGQGGRAIKIRFNSAKGKFILVLSLRKSS